MADEPFHKTKEEYQYIIEQISVSNSPVGIDAQYTHAIIIDYLRNISQKLDRIEKKIGSN